MACQVVLADRPLVDPDASLNAHIDLEGTPKAAPLARRFVRSLLDGLSDTVVADVELLTSELVTNVVLHARTHVHPGLSRDDERVLVVVQDFSDRTSPPRAAVSGDELAESGRGMAIIANLADDFGWQRLHDRDGKLMWFVVGIRQRTDHQPLWREPIGQGLP